jgi:hypothetical protein
MIAKIGLKGEPAEPHERGETTKQHAPLSEKETRLRIISASQRMLARGYRQWRALRDVL